MKKGLTSKIISSNAASKAEHRVLLFLESGSVPWALLFLATLMVGAAAWYSIPFARKLKADKEAFDLERAPEGDLSLTNLNIQELQALQFAFAATHQGNFIVQYFPGWQSNDFREIVNSDALFYKLADTTPPPGQIWSYTSANNSITGSYASLLDDVRMIAEETARTRQHNDKLLEASSTLHNTLHSSFSGPEVIPNSADFGALISDLFAGLPNIPEASAAWRAYIGRPPGPPVYINESDMDFINGRDDDGLAERHLTYDGMANVDQDTAPGLTIPVQVFGGQYRIVPFQRASWFKADLVKQAQAAAVVVPIFQRYFGAEGSLQRLPSGAILIRENGFIFRADLSGTTGSNICENATRIVKFTVRNTQIMLPCARAQKIGPVLLWVVPQDGITKIRVVGIVVEVL